MNEQEKMYHSISRIGAGNIALGVLVLVTGVVTGVLAIVNGARLLASRKNILL
ncbi:MAG: hypothetical protein Q4B57_10910 [Eubacteriales bacterium]|nr:hypothetical protein [Eubacteriales bacterium]